jgi:hypothetical protein
LDRNWRRPLRRGAAGGDEQGGGNGEKAAHRAMMARQ